MELIHTETLASGERLEHWRNGNVRFALLIAPDGTAKRAVLISQRSQTACSAQNHAPEPPPTGTQSKPSAT